MFKVSVIVPIYNAEKYLKQCLDSIQCQTLKDIEVILIDDGSTDGSSKIAKAYLSDNRFTYYYKENEGLAAARADGIERASGEYLGFIDSDDWIEPDMYEKMYKAAKSNDSDIVFCNCIQNADGHKFNVCHDFEAMLSDIVRESKPGDVILVMSNGGFNGIQGKLLERL